jgi:hypothetical protein
MTNISGWTTFREVVDNVNLAGGDSSDMGHFMRKLNFAIRGYEKLRLHSLPATKSVTRSIDGEMRIVVLPDDFLKFVSVGIVNNGHFYEFRPKSDMLLIATANCGTDSRTIPTAITGQSLFTAYYSLDLENRRIIIDCPVSVTEVMLNYTPTGVKLDGVTYIPRMCAAVIEAFVEWQCALRDKVPAYDKESFKAEYIKELNLFIGLQYNTDELFNELYEHLATGKQY